MSSAIHKTESGDSLTSIAKLYYAIDDAKGDSDILLAGIIQHIREGTPTSVFDLTSKTDTEDLGAGNTLFIPTTRRVARAVLCDNSTLASDLAAEGFESADRLLAVSASDVEARLAPLPVEYDAADIQRCWVLTAFLNLDGMDTYTAVHLYDTESITSLATLAAQTEASLATVLDTLVASPHFRPAELDQQGHERRWRLEAKLYTRTKVSEIAKGRAGLFATPVNPDDVRANAEHYESMAIDDDVDDEESALARRLGLLLRFQEYLLRGHVAVSAHRWAEARSAYDRAAESFHLLAVDVGTTASVGSQGLSTNDASDAIRRLLDVLPADAPNPLGARTLRPFDRQPASTFGLRAFTYAELETSGTDRKSQLRTDLGGAQVHALPRGLRSRLHRALAGKTHTDLSNADSALTTGLVSAAGASRVRDLEPQDRKTARRNLGAITVSKTYSGGTNLDVFESVGDAVALSEVASLVPSLWDTGEKADDVLSTAAKANYPSAFLARSDVTPFVKYVRLPAATGASDDTFIPVTSASFVTDYSAEVIKPRVRGGGMDLHFADECWATCASFASIAPVLYAVHLQLGRKKAIANSGATSTVSFGTGARVNLYDSSGNLVRDIEGLDGSDVAAAAVLGCGVDWDSVEGDYAKIEVLEEAQAAIRVADRLYRNGDTSTARRRYTEVMCVLESFGFTVVTESRAALGAVYDAVQSVKDGGLLPDWDYEDLYGFNTTYVESSTLKRILDGVLIVVDPYQYANVQYAGAQNIRQQVVAQTFKFFGAPSITDAQLDSDVPSFQPSIEVTRQGAFLVTLSYDAEASAEIYQYYLYCAAKVAQIDADLNWFGYPHDYVPPWSFEHLHGLASDVAAKAVRTEERVLGLLQSYEAALKEELKAVQAAELAFAQTAVADAALAQAVAAYEVAVTEAAVAVEQAAKQDKRSGITNSIVVASLAVVPVAVGVGVTIATEGAGAVPAAVFIGAAVTGISAFVGTHLGHSYDENILALSQSLLESTETSAQAGITTALAQRDVAILSATQAADFLTFLQEETLLNSSGYAYLLSLLAQVSEAYHDQANLLAWLAQRAIEHRTRSSMGVVKTGYYLNETLGDLTRSQRLAVDLDAIRTRYVASQSQRLQSIKWTIPLSALDPRAWGDLRSTGEASIFIRQDLLDRAFPGMYLHALKELQVAFIGLLPATGVRGTLRTVGSSWVRVPDAASHTGDALTTADWTTDPLAAASAVPGEDDASLTGYAAYVLRQVSSNGVAIALSEFDVARDRAVLSVPQGMLGPVEHHGLDTHWWLSLPQISNEFDFSDIIDVELTLWFTAAFDPALEAAQREALGRMGRNGDLRGSKRTSLAHEDPDTLAELRAEPSDEEALDLRVVTLDVSNLSRWEKDRLLENFGLFFGATEDESQQVTVRVANDVDPVGASFTSVDHGIYSLIDVDLSGYTVESPTRMTSVETWVNAKLRNGTSNAPSEDPEMRWVVKFSPTTIESAWTLTDEDGNALTTTSGALQGTATAATAEYDDGTAWGNVICRVKVRHNGGTLRVRVRDDGTDYYAVQISPTDVKLIQSGSTLATKSLAYPSTEFLLVEVGVSGQELYLSIDGLVLWDWEAVTGTASHTTGTVILEVVDASGGSPEFDDVEVWRVTGLFATAEKLLTEPFTSTLPTDWTFTASAWSIGGTGHKLLDLEGIRNVLLQVDYLHEVV